MERDPSISEESISKVQDLLEKFRVLKIEKKGSNLKEVVSSFLANHEEETPFFMVNIGDTIRQYENWRRLLPHIQPFFAVKCNPDPLVIEVLQRLGCGFDCASQNEIAKTLKAGASPEDVIFAHPCKMPSMIKYAKANNVALMTLDSEEELEKIKQHYPEAKLVIRIFTDTSKALFNLSAKFGCTLEDAISLLHKSKDLDLNVVGVSFHVGAGYSNSATFEKAIKDAKTLFDLGKDLGHDMNLLDIGGGFPGRDTETVSFKFVAENIRQALENHFSGRPDLKIISEPGRFFVTTTHTLVTSIVNKKYRTHPTTGERHILYYLDDGTYNSFFHVPMDHQVISEENTFPLEHVEDKTLHRCMMFGPTTSKIDVVSNEIMLPDLEVGNRLVHIDMGAYSVACHTGEVGFCDLERARIFYYLN